MNAEGCAAGWKAINAAGDDAANSKVFRRDAGRTRLAINAVNPQLPL